MRPIYSKSDYIRFHNINNRCYNPNHPKYDCYGGRGITNFWKDDFDSFQYYIRLLPGYGIDFLTLDRKDNDGNYEPGNLQWASLTEQNQNKRPHYRKRKVKKDESVI